MHLWLNGVLIIHSLRQSNMANNEFDPQALLDKVLSIGKEYVEKGQSIAEEKLNIPEGGEEREVMLDGLKKGALASALLVGLFGTKGGRSLTGSALKIGGLAALGTAAFKGYQNWRATGDVMTSVHELQDSAGEGRSLLLIQAMVAAANADGRIDDEEQSQIKHQILEMSLPGEIAITLENIIDSPLSAQELAQLVSDQTTASEVYLATRLLIDENSSIREKMYRDSLVAALDLPSELISSLDAEVA